MIRSKTQSPVVLNPFSIIENMRWNLEEQKEPLGLTQREKQLLPWVKQLGHRTMNTKEQGLFEAKIYKAPLGREQLSEIFTYSVLVDENKFRVNDV